MVDLDRKQCLDIIDYNQYMVRATGLYSIESSTSIRKKGHDMATETEAAKARLIKDFKAVIHDAEELLKATSNQTGEKIAGVRARAEENIRSARQKIDELEGDMTERARAAYQATDQMVHDNPWQSAGIAAGVGFLLGLLLGRR